MLKQDKINEEGLFNFVEFLLKEEFQPSLVSIYLRAIGSEANSNLIIKAYYYKTHGNRKMCQRLLRRVGIDISESGGFIYPEQEQ